MSEDKHYKGKLKATGKTLEEYIGEGFDADEVDAYLINYNLCILEGLVHKIVVEVSDPYTDIFSMRRSAREDVLEFEVKFYDGGCSLPEALEEAYKGMRDDSCKIVVKTC